MSTLTIRLTPERRRRLQRAAEARGTALETYVEGFLDEHLQNMDTLGGAALTPQQRAEAFLAWANGHRPDLPVPPADAMKRESLYEGRP